MGRIENPVGTRLIATLVPWAFPVVNWNRIFWLPEPEYKIFPNFQEKTDNLELNPRKVHSSQFSSGISRNILELFKTFSGNFPKIFGRITVHEFSKSKITIFKEALVNDPAFFMR